MSLGLKTGFNFNIHVKESVDTFGWIFPAMKDSKYDMGGRDYLLGFGASVGYMSPIGPISFSVGKDIHSNKMQHFLNIGFYFDPD
jgi:outer membrane protein assembly factor BamA